MRALFSCRHGQQKTDATFFKKDERTSHVESISVVTMAFFTTQRGRLFFALEHTQVGADCGPLRGKAQDLSPNDGSQSSWI